jgi:ribosome maturation factor RimP
MIQKAVELTTMSGDGDGPLGMDVTWYLTHVVVTVADDFGSHVPKDFIKTHGPVIDVDQPETPSYKDPADPNPEDIWEDDEDISYQRDEETEDDLKSKTYTRQEDGEEGLGVPEEEPVPLYASQESREDDAVRVAEEADLLQLKEERALDVEALKIDTVALSVLAGAIMDALETVEDELKILERHELILASTGAQDVLETQTQFDSHRGYDVAVETQDPWGSNRTLRGKLVDRNAMDVIINQKGRMITIPHNFIKCVRLPQTRRNSEADVENGFDMEEDEDIYEE